MSKYSQDHYVLEAVSPHSYGKWSIPNVKGDPPRDVHRATIQQHSGRQAYDMATPEVLKQSALLKLHSGELVAHHGDSHGVLRRDHARQTVNDTTDVYMAILS